MNMYIYIYIYICNNPKTEHQYWPISKYFIPLLHWNEFRYDIDSFDWETQYLFMLS